MNKVVIKCFTDGSANVWVLDSNDRMLECVPFLHDAQVEEICRDYDAYIHLDEREEE